MWVSTASGFLGFEIELAAGFSSPQVMASAWRGRSVDQEGEGRDRQEIYVEGKRAGER